MSKLKVLISGASIAGPTAAYWLARAGADVTVVERFPQLRAGGQSVDIRTVGVTVMRKMPGMEEAVKAHRSPIDGISFVNTHGRPYGTITASGDPNQQSLVSEYEIFRGDLSRILYDMTKDHPSVKYVFNEQISSIQQSSKVDGPVTVKFANGLPTDQYDLVIACDGASSRTRALGLGCGQKDHVVSSSFWAAYFSIKESLLKGSHIGQAYCSPGGRFFALGTDLSGKTRATFMNFQPSANNDTMQSFRKAVESGDDALRAFVAQLYSGAGWKCNEAIESMRTADDFYASEGVQVKLPSLSKGRFVLVGDAGYAPGPVGTGTSLALAGAYVLAGEIHEHKDDLPAALAAYEARMRPLIDDFQKIPPFLSSFIAPQTAWGIWLRNSIFSFITNTGILGFVQKFFAGAFANVDKYPLPDYKL